MKHYTHNNTLNRLLGSHKYSALAVVAIIFALAASPLTGWGQTLYSNSNMTATAGTSGVSGQNYDKLVDGSSSTKWCVISLGSPTYIEFNSAALITPVSYVMTTGEDTQGYPNRNPISWTVKAKANSSDDWTTLDTQTNNYTLEALNSTSYEFSITNSTAYQYFRFEVQSTGGSEFQLIEFQFKVISNGSESSDDFQIGDGTSTSTSGSGNTVNGSPMGNTYYYYSTAQFIFTISEMGGAKTLKSIKFYHNAQSFTSTVRIYLAYTSYTNFSELSPVTDATLVYTGTNITVGGSSAGWQEFEFGTPFEYDGTSNLVVIVCRGHSSGYNSSQTWYYTSGLSERCYIARYADYSEYGDITSSSNYGTSQTNRPSTVFTYEAGSYVSSTTIPTVTTTSGATAAETTASCSGDVTSDGNSSITERGICYRVAGTGDVTASDSHVTYNSNGTGSYNVTLTGLTPGTTYRYRAYAKNSQGTAYGTTYTFTTTSNDYLMNSANNGATFTTCSGYFYDEGGASNSYSTNSVDWTMTFQPGTSGKMIEVRFTSYSLESSSNYYDYLQIYNGTSTSAPQIGGNYITSPGTVTASNCDGALTFKWHTDSGGSGAGWAATISCVDPTITPIYEINSSDDWDAFCTSICMGYEYSDETVTLKKDISVTTMAGAVTNPGDNVGTAYPVFCGTFNGGGHTITVDYTATEWYCAPFRGTRGATINNLRVDGTISTEYKFAAGIVGLNRGSSSTPLILNDCVSDVEITSFVSGDGTHGGLVANLQDGANQLNGCAFTGKLLGLSTTHCGGLVGVNVNNPSESLTLTNCVFAPRQVTMSTTSSYTLSRGSGVTINNCYYTQAFGTTQGKQAYTITGSDVTVQMRGSDTEYTTSGITAYSGNVGLYFDNPNSSANIIAGNSDAVLLSFSCSAPSTGYSLSYAASNGTLGSGPAVNDGTDDYTLTMTTANSEITKSYTEIDYSITYTPNSGDCYISGTTTAHYNNSITVTIHVAAGYQLQSISAEDADSNSVDLLGTGTGDGATRTFTMPANNVTVTATFRKLGTVTIGSGTTTTNGGYLPTHFYYRYSHTQQIYTASELGNKAFVITDISFYYNSSTLDSRSNFDLYMSHTSSSNLASNYEAVTEDDMVFSGTFSVGSSSGWYIIHLDTPFEYNGTSNLLLTVNDHKGSYSDTRSFRTYSSGSSGSERARYAYVDGSTPYDPTSPTGGTASQYNNQIKLNYEYKITAQSNPTAGGTVKIGSGSAGTEVSDTFVEESSVQLQATPNTGYSFSSWSDGGAQTHNVTVTANASYTANFTQNNYTISYSPASPGSSTNGCYVSGVTSAHYQDNITVTLTIPAGYELSTFTVKDASNNNVSFTGSGNTRSFTMPASNVSVTATFAASSFSLTLNASPTAGGKVSIDGGSPNTSVSGSYAYNTSHTIAATPINSDWVFYKWSDGNTNASRSFTIPASATTLTAYFAPLKINNATEWGYFADAVNSGFNYSGEIVTMTGNVGTALAPVDIMVGVRDPAKYFCGTFDGGCNTITFSKTVSEEYCAPFRRIDGATIQNVKVAGDVTITSGRYAGGVVAYTKGTSTITNCINSTNITSNVNGDGSCGGIVGQIGGNQTCNISGCVFNGTMTGSNTDTWAGMVGYCRGGGTVANITNCIFAPTSVTIKESTNSHYTMVHTVSNGETYGVANVTNSYYTYTMSNTAANNQGTLAYTLDFAASPVAGGTVSHAGSGTEYDCSGITAYTTGLAYDIDNDAADELLLGDGESATITASANSGYTFMNWIDGSNSPVVNPYTVTMGTADRTVTAHFVDQTAGGGGGGSDWVTTIDAIGDVPSSGYTTDGDGNVTISNKEGLAWLVSVVNGLNGQTANKLSGKTITLTADVDMSAHTWVPIGTAEHSFQGTFEGNGHVIKGITRSDEFPHNGLFGYVDGTANIKDVVVEASLTGNSVATGAVAGTFASSGTISNVEGAGTLTGGALTTAIGGLVGNKTGGTIHSSFAVATLNGSASSTQMGGLVGTNTGNVYNSYGDATFSGSTTNKGGLVGSNASGSIIENCYAAGVVSGVSAFAVSNSGTIQNCYTDAVGKGYVDDNTTAPTGCGTYGAVQSSIKHLDYMYRDNLIAASTNTYVGGAGVTAYVDRHIPVWNGLVSALNQWVRANPRSVSGLTSWQRPLTTNINGDLPVLVFPMDNSLGTLDADGKYLQYGSNQGANGLDAVLTTYYNTTASIFHYGKATGVTRVPTANVKVTVAEDAVLLQDDSKAGDFINTTVGITFDNSDRGAHAYDFWGNKLHYDWHLLSTPLYQPLTGAVHSTYQPSNNPYSAVDITSIGGYFPDGLIVPDSDDPNYNPAVGGTIKWDFYTYYEPDYHWINLKRNKKNHYHQDTGAQITYNEADQDLGSPYTAYYIPGKGYEMAINQDTYMNATGTLNKGDVIITLTNQEPDDLGGYAKGWNLVGNPYQAYLDLEEIKDKLPVYIYDADWGVYVPYAKSSSENPVLPSRYIHPHQAFFVHTATNGATLTFTQDMATDESSASSYFREKVNYPLVNLFADDDVGHRDLTVIEFHRPELGGAPKLDYMRTAPFSLAAHYAGKSYGILFATDDIERVPVKFKPGNGGLITLTWITHNGEFSMLNLIDNKLGVEHNMLADNTYVFEASPDDYSSRFYITYECSGTGIEENDDDGASTGAATFAYINNGNIVIDVGSGHGASLQMIDVLGRVMYSKTLAGTDGACTVSTHGLAKGVYILRLSNNQGVKTQKIVLQ